jgi:serine/threonine-protein kinase RsbW
MNAQPPGVPSGGLRTCDLVDGDLRLILNNTMAAIEDGRARMAAYLEPMSLSALIVNRIEVVFEEVISNIVRHGFSQGSDQTILVLVARRQDSLDLTFEDDGTPFNPLDAPKPEPLRSIETAKLGGLGISLVRKMSASLRYEPIGSGEVRRDLGGRLFEPRNRLMVSIAAPG